MGLDHVLSFAIVDYTEMLHFLFTLFRLVYLDIDLWHQTKSISYSSSQIRLMRISVPFSQLKPEDAKCKNSMKALFPAHVGPVWPCLTPFPRAY